MTVKIISENRRAHFNYFIFDKFEAGLILAGNEVKSLRESRVSLQDSYAQIENGEIFLFNCHIKPYSHMSTHQLHDPMRKRKLLLHGREIMKLVKSTTEKGLSIIPLKIYFKRGYAKIVIATAKGKKLYDKRNVIKKRDNDRDIQNAMKHN